tara:strand:- start:281 stop:712 length:432 start_codon:yes stop_codon:yes gene_type:complete
MKTIIAILVLLLSSSLLADEIYLDCNYKNICIYQPTNEGCREYDSNFVLIFDEENEKAQQSVTNITMDLNVLEITDHVIVLGSPQYKKKDYENYSLSHPFEGYYFTWVVNRISGKGEYKYVQEDGLIAKYQDFECVLKEEKLF